MDYVKKQAELQQLKQALKVWSHRKKIQYTALTSCRSLLHKLTINSLPSTRWARHVDHLLHIQMVNEYLKQDYLENIEETIYRLEVFILEW
jgi:hypothetical protein